MTTLNDTPSSNRIHIGLYGKRNSGKSSLLNALAGQDISIVSDTAGTTTDPVNKPMEIHGLGACVLIDTAGFDDTGALGESRTLKTKASAEKTDIAILLFSDSDISLEKEWLKLFNDRHTPVIAVISKSDLRDDVDSLRKIITNELNITPIIVSSATKEGMESLMEALLRALPEDFEPVSILGNLVNSKDCVMLVMPQDIQAPKGRLILPQVQTIRELLDNKCTVVCCTTDTISDTLDTLKRPPKLIVTDSQAFKTVYDSKPAESMLTSFSVLFASYKGDIRYYIESSCYIDKLTEHSKVLIAECCTHAPLAEDIGRVKLPNLLRKRVDARLSIDIISGTDFPEDLTGYDLIIQCGACMFNRKYVLSRINRAKEQSVPMTNYGIAIAKLTNILDKIVYP